MDVKSALKGVELLEGLTDSELEEMASICQKRSLGEGEAIAIQGEPGDEMFIVTEGFVEVVHQSIGSGESRAVVQLGAGQIVGEMALIDQGPRSATVRSVSAPTIVQVLRREEFDALCERNHHIGYIVMRNMAADLSFRIRHRNLTDQR